MVVARKRYTVVILDHGEAEKARKLFVNGHGKQFHTVDVDDSQDNGTAEIAAGAFAGGLVGVMLGAFAGIGVLTVPGVVLLPLIVGTTGTYVVTSLAGAGLGALSGGLAASLLLRSEKVSD